MSLYLKNWFSQIDSHHKFLSSVITYGLSKKLDRYLFEVVNESYIDLTAIESDIADVVIYDLRNHLHPLMIIELCDQASESITLSTVEIISKIYQFKESFVYNTSTSVWHKITISGIINSPISTVYNINLEEILNTNLHLYY